jgi:hypothetical protein
MKNSVFNRRTVLKTAVAGATLALTGSPAVHAQQKSIRFLNAEPGRDSV